MSHSELCGNCLCLFVEYYLAFSYLVPTKSNICLSIPHMALPHMALKLILSSVDDIDFYDNVVEVLKLH